MEKDTKRSMDESRTDRNMTAVRSFRSLILVRIYFSMIFISTPAFSRKIVLLRKRVPDK